ncbi:MAG TPA: carboxypeptidase-like regulatory domain-containing protein [Gemmatimonadales bacterium]
MRGDRVLLLALFVRGCAISTDPTRCTEEARAGMALTLRDATTGRPVSVGARIIARDGEYSESTEFNVNGTYPLAFERRGAYEVTVEHPGYRPWVRIGIQVTGDACHVTTIFITADLEPRA